jgi:hypothetical protein
VFLLQLVTTVAWGWLWPAVLCLQENVL